MINTNNTRLDIYRQQGNTEQNKKSSNESQLNALATRYGNNNCNPSSFINDFESAINAGVFKTDGGFDNDPKVMNFLDQIFSLTEQKNNVNRYGLYFMGQELLSCYYRYKI